MAKPKKKPKAKVKPPTGDVLTLAEAADYLRVEATGLQADAVAGRVPGQFVAGEWRFSRLALIAWLSGPFRPNQLDLPVPDETPEEQEAFLELMRKMRKSWGTVEDAMRAAS